MTENPGSALKAAENHVKADQARKKRTAALHREWVGDSEMNAEQLAAKLTALREDMYQRHPELRVTA